MTISDTPSNWDAVTPRKQYAPDLTEPSRHCTSTDTVYPCQAVENSSGTAFTCNDVQQISADHATSRHSMYEAPDLRALQEAFLSKSKAFGFTHQIRHVVLL
jgi:hypothetical protein